MSITAQHHLDLHRAARHGAPLPPAPGRHDWRVLKELWRHVRAGSVRR
ncbi:hypothetical protein H9Y04_35940 [Streptomyces sp. TRM66268-LWL]|uniref:Transposase n=1 Tax=Streptomyces polyasparticus TaxID=2767826 RepID=A0ABR7SR03_9ACTN|nr:hypothetical protein [Streptomyces polyasparticus]MBC9717937.1 hypothetical protein [Streptomyces polyasparticus]